MNTVRINPLCIPVCDRCYEKGHHWNKIHTCVSKNIRTLFDLRADKLTGTLRTGIAKERQNFCDGCLGFIMGQYYDIKPSNEYTSN